MKTSRQEADRDLFSELLSKVQANRTRPISKEMAFLKERKDAIARARRQGLSMQGIIDAAQQLGVKITHHHVKRFVHEELGETAKSRAKRIAKRPTKISANSDRASREHQVTLEEAIAEARKRS